MRSLSRVIKSSSLVVAARAREVNFGSDILPKRGGGEARTAADQSPAPFGEAEARNIISETEAIIKQLMERAEQQAAALIQKARAQAEELLQEARSQAEELKRKSQEQGYQEGRQRIAEEMESARQNALQEAEQIIEQARRERDQLLAEVEPQTLELALAIARRVIGRELLLHPETVQDIAREALKQAKGGDELVVKVHETSYEALRAGWEELVAEDDLARRSRIEVDNLVEPGGCVVDTRSGRIDAQVSTQLAVIGSALKQVKNGG